MADSAFLVFQEAIQVYPELLYEKALEHVIVSSVYSAAVAKKKHIKFN